MKKIIHIIIMFIVNCAIFAVLWNTTFSIASAGDKWFLIGYIDIFLVFLFLFYFFRKKKKFIQYILAACFCIFTLAAVLGYRGWNRHGFSIRPDEVEYVNFCSIKDRKDIVRYDSNTGRIDEFVKIYNDTDCVKRWDGGGRVGTPEEYIIVHLTDGSSLTVEEDGCIIIGDKEYKTALTLEKLLMSLETD